MTKTDLLSVYGTLGGIAKLFSSFNNGRPLSVSAVGQWGETVPELRQYQIRAAVPDINKRLAAVKRKRLAPKRRR